MSLTPGAEKFACQAMQELLLRGQATPTRMRDRAGLVAAATSDTNLVGVGFTSFPDKKKKKVELQYLKRQGQSELPESELDLCADGDAIEYDNVILEANRYAAKKIKLPGEDFLQMCADRSDKLAQLLDTTMNDLISQIERICIAEIALGQGTLRGGASTSALNLWDNSARALNANDWSRMKQDMRKIGSGANFFVVGLGEMVIIDDVRKIGCCNTISGLDMTRAYDGINFFEDDYTDDYLGTDEIICLMPGAFVIVPWMRCEKIPTNPRDDKSIFERGRLVDWYTGLEFDYYISSPGCQREADWNITIELNFNPHIIPSGFTSGDPLYGSNGVLVYETTMGS